MAAAVVSGLLLAGCGGGFPSTNTTAGGARSTATGTTGGAAGAAGGGDTKTTKTGSRTPAHGQPAHPSALAFSKCMRANGVPSFPDPSPGGGFSFHVTPAVMSSPAFRAAQAKCQRFMPGGGPLSPGSPPSARTMARLRRIASCMRLHGVPQFPDPLSTPPPQSSINMSDYSLITNYMGAILMYPRSIDMRSPAYEHAIAACGAGFLAGQDAHPR